ncbi:hypothetical protein JCM10213_008829 [Rhodosporidiobolus nylandii]
MTSSASSSGCSSFSASASSHSLPLTPSSSQDHHPPTPGKEKGFAFNPSASLDSLSLPASTPFAGAQPSPAFSPSSTNAPERTRKSSAVSSILPSSRSRTSSRPSLLTPPPSPPQSRSSPHTSSRHAHQPESLRGSAPPAPLTDVHPDFMSAAISDAQEAEEQCPICLEDLALRLAGEKPHVVPVCGHRLHHDCFIAVYGDVERAKMKTSGSLGLCGVCRREMKIGEAGDAPGKRNKFAKLSGLPSAADSSLGTFKIRSRTQGTLYDDDAAGSRDESQDDDLVQLPPPGSLGNLHPPMPAGTRSSSQSTGSTLTASSATFRGSADTYLGRPGSSTSAGSRGTASSGAVFEIVKPIVTVRAEHSSVERSTEPDKKQHLTCLVSIELPPRYPAPLHLLQVDSPPAPDDAHAQPPPPLPPGRSPGGGPASVHSIPRSASPTSVYSAYAYGSTPVPPSGAPGSPLAGIVEDLRTRMADWKGHSPDEFGQLRLHDHIQVRKDTATREFLVYLFEEAILCVTDDKRKGLAKLADSVSGNNDKLRLKGRVYLRHVARIVDTSHGRDLSLTITMTDDAVASFVMLFRERASLDMWKTQIEKLLAVHSPLGSSYSSGQPGLAGRAPSDISSSDQSRMTGFSNYTRTTSTSLAPSGSVILEEDETADEFGRFAAPNGPGYASSSKSSTIGSYTPSAGGRLHAGSSQNVLNQPRTFTPLDLMLILSVPTSGPTALKTGILKNALEFLISHVGPRTRLSIVTYSQGDGARGVLRKTPFIAVGKADGKKRLEKVIEELGCDAEDLTSMIPHQEERVNVVTACNLALDIILQRKAKSALTGMILINDGRDGAARAQMDLVQARTEAANVPIHTIGYGRSHDPSSLWLLSNHSAGSYTFVKDFYDLRDALAGCVGGILSIAATNVRLHIKVPEQRWFRIRKVSGTPGAIVSKTGTDVDVELGELRFGERKDLIVEVEMSLGGYGEAYGQRERSEHRQPPQVEYASATDAFFLSQVGINPSALDEYSSSSLYDDEYDQMPDEAPLFEVNAAYRDPAAGKSISRLNHSPTLLTITVNPPSSVPRQHPQASAPGIVRRRMELLVSDMLSRALLLMTRRNDAQAARLLDETKRIIKTIAASLVSPAPSGLARVAGRRSSLAAAATTIAQRTLAALAEDVEAVYETCLNRELFDTDGRYLAAQQAVVLRDQRAWTPRTATERLVWRADNSLFLVGKSQAWMSASDT